MSILTKIMGIVSISVLCVSVVTAAPRISSSTNDYLDATIKALKEAALNEHQLATKFAASSEPHANALAKVFKSAGDSDTDVAKAFEGLRDDMGLAKKYKMSSTKCPPGYAYRCVGRPMHCYCRSATL